MCGCGGVRSAHGLARDSHVTASAPPDSGLHHRSDSFLPACLKLRVRGELEGGARGAPRPRGLAPVLEFLLSRLKIV